MANTVSKEAAPIALLVTICDFFTKLNTCTITEPTIGIDCSSIRFNGVEIVSFNVIITAELIVNIIVNVNMKIPIVIIKLERIN